MTQEQHPITPPPELVQQWQASLDCPDNSCAQAKYIAARAARWGADQELEACCHLLRQQGFDVVEDLRAARRPKSPSLAEEALQEINEAECYMDSANLGGDFTAVRRALERLQELEGQGDD